MNVIPLQCERKKQLIILKGNRRDYKLKLGRYLQHQKYQKALIMNLKGQREKENETKSQQI